MSSIIVLLAVVIPSFGQISIESLVFIHVADVAGTDIPQVKVEFKSDSTSKTVDTKGDGAAQLSLPPGRYEVTLNKPGFTVTKVLNFVIGNRVPAILNVTLRVGAPPIIEPRDLPEAPILDSDIPTKIISGPPLSPNEERISLPLPSMPGSAWPSELGWTPVMRLCGRLRTEMVSGTTGILPEIEIRLYEAKWRAPCCENLRLVGREVTGVHGYFDFGPLNSGRYWLALEWKEQNYVFPIDIDSGHKWSGSCDNQGPLIGRYSAWVVLTQGIM